MKEGGEFSCSLIYFLVFWYMCSCYVFYYSPLQKQPPEVYYKKGVLKNFAKFRRKHLCLTPVTLLKKRPWHRCFPLNFAKFLRAPFLQNTSGRLLLPMALPFYGILNSVNLFLIQQLYWWTYQNFIVSGRSVSLTKGLVSTIQEVASKIDLCEIWK